MSESIGYIDRSDIIEGKLEEFKEGINALVGFVDAHEQQLISYGFSSTMKSRRWPSSRFILTPHPWSSTRREFRNLKEYVELRAIDVYGQPRTRH